MGRDEAVDETVDEAAEDVRGAILGTEASWTVVLTTLATGSASETVFSETVVVGG